MTQKLDLAFIKNSLAQLFTQKLTALKKMVKLLQKEHKQSIEEYTKTVHPRYWRPYIF